MHFLEEFLNALLIIPLIVDNYLNLPLPRRRFGWWCLKPIHFLLPPSHTNRHKGFHFFNVTELSLSIVTLRTHRFGMLLLLYYDRSLQQHRLFCTPNILVVSAATTNFHLHSRTVVVARLGRLAIRYCLLLVHGNLVLAIVRLKGTHNLRCLFAERHRNKLFKLLYRRTVINLKLVPIRIGTVANLFVIKV